MSRGHFQWFWENKVKLCFKALFKVKQRQSDIPKFDEQGDLSGEDFLAEEDSTANLSLIEEKEEGDDYFYSPNGSLLRAADIARTIRKCFSCKWL